MNADHLSLDELAVLVDMPPRTIRYYIQPPMSLVDRPEGVGKGAYYTRRHVEQLLRIRKWRHAGLSLERIAQLMGGPDEEPVPPLPRAGSVEVWSRLTVADGVEVQIEPSRARLSPEQVRALFRAIGSAFEQIQKEGEER